MLTVYFACDYDTALRMGERSGGYGEDENSDTYWVRAVPHEDDIVFHLDKTSAITYALQNKLEEIYEARIEPETCVQALGCALANEVSELDFMVKLVLKLQAV